MWFESVYEIIYQYYARAKVTYANLFPDFTNKARIPRYTS